MYSGKTAGVNYYNSIDETTSAGLDFRFLEYKYTDYLNLNGDKKIITANLSKSIAPNNRLDIQLSHLDTNAVDKTSSYKQPQLRITNTREFKGGWTLGLTGTLNTKKYIKESPFFGIKRNDKTKSIELSVINSLFNIKGLSPKIKFGIIKNSSNINLYEFNRRYYKLEFTKEF